LSSDINTTDQDYRKKKEFIDKSMVVIIDYGMGNLFSVQNALRVLKADAVISKDPEDLKNASHIILPGVGAFPDGMKNLKASGFVEILKREVLENKKPFLGICLGMQMLASIGEEHVKTEGLGLIPGAVRSFQVPEKEFRIPHVGWNDAYPTEAGKVLFDGVDQNVFYFVHSYHFVPDDTSTVAAWCDYGECFVAAVRKDNIFGVQFHPEKSQKNGLMVLENFLKA